MAGKRKKKSRGYVSITNHLSSEFLKSKRHFLKCRFLRGWVILTSTEHFVPKYRLHLINRMQSGGGILFHYLKEVRWNRDIFITQNLQLNCNAFLQSFTDDRSVAGSDQTNNDGITNHTGRYSSYQACWG